MPSPGPDFSQAKALYAEQCQACHGDEQGNNVVSGDALTAERCDTCTSLDRLRIKIRDTMPYTDAMLCDDDCAAKLASYILLNFDGFNGETPSEKHSVVLEAENATLEGDLNPSSNGHIRVRTTDGISYVTHIGKGNQIAFYQTHFETPGVYEVSVRYSSAVNRGLHIRVGDETLTFSGLNTGDFDTSFAEVSKVILVSSEVADVVAGLEAANAVNIDKITFTLVEEIQTEPLSCASDLVLGKTPLQRLTAAEYSQSVKDLVGLDLSANLSSLPGDEKISKFFDGNSSLPMSEADFEKYLLMAEYIATELNDNGPMPEACQRLSINSAGPIYEPFGGVHYIADNYVDGGREINTDQSIPGTGAQIIYGTARVGEFNYAVPVASGDYNIMLHFTELEYDNVGDRIFNVYAEGQLVFDSHDILSKVNKFNINNESFEIRVDDGELNLAFVPANKAFMPGADQCNFTSECSSRWPAASDCANSSAADSVCMCGASRCDAAQQNDGSFEAIVSGMRITPAIGNEDRCMDAYVSELAPKIFRRNLSGDEKTRLLDMYKQVRSSSGSSEQAYTALMTSLFASPNFIYRYEGSANEAGYLAGDYVDLSDYELATRLAYFLWGTTPDQQLMQRAQQNELSDADIYGAEVERMLADERAQRRITGFYVQWLGVDDVAGVEKIAELYPDFSKEVAVAMLEDFSAYIDDIYRGDTPSFFDLYEPGQTRTENTALQNIYGVFSDADNPAALPAGLRHGVLTHPAVMSTYAHSGQTSPVARGVFIRNRFFCQDLPPPPPDVDDAEPDIDENATTRERFAAHSSNPACAGCHALIDPIGFAFENYDAVGAYRDSEFGLAIDVEGKLIGTDVNGSFHGVGGLADKLASSQQVQACFVENWLTYALARGMEPQDDCEIDALVENFNLSGGDLNALMRDIVKSRAFKTTRTSSDNK